MNGEMSPLYGKREQRAPEGSVLGAAFRLGNDVVNTWGMLTSEYSKPDPTFDYRQHFDDTTMNEAWRPLLASARSEGEFADKLESIRQETKDREILAASGMGGLVAGFAAGMVSPTALIPFAGQARGVAALGEVAALAATAGVIQESAIYGNQELATGEEFLQGVAMQTVLAGLMGTAWLKMSKSGRARLTREVEEGNGYVNVPDGPLDVGPTGQVTRVRLDEPEVTLPKTPDLTGRDSVATPNAKLEADVPSGYLRVYYSGELGEGVGPGVRAVADREAAAAMSPDHPLYSFDVRADAVDELPGGELVLSRAQMDELKEVFRGETPRAPEEVVGPEGQTTKEALSDDMAPLQSDGTIRQPIDPDDIGAGPGRGSLGAAEIRPRNYTGLQAAPNKVQQALLKSLGWVSPQYRMATSKIGAFRDAIFRLDSSGLKQGGLDAMEGSAMGGSVKDRVLQHYFPLVKFMETMDMEYYRYLYGKVPENFERVRLPLAQIKTQLGMVPEGKMSWVEFNEAVYDAASTGKGVTPELKTSVEAANDFFRYFDDVHTEYHAELQAVDPEVAPLYVRGEKSALGPGVENYIHMKYDPEVLQDRMSEFIDDVARWTENNQIDSFSRSHKRFQKKLDGLKFDLEYLKMSDEAKGDAFADVQAGLLLHRDSPDMDLYYEQRKAFRESPEYIGADKSGRAALTKEFHEGLPAPLREAVAEDRRLAGLAAYMRQNGGNNVERLAKLEGEIEQAEGLLSGMLERLAPRLQKIDTASIRASKNYDKEVTKVTQVLEEAREALVKHRLNYTTALNKSGVKAGRLFDLKERMATREQGFTEALERFKSLGTSEANKEAKLAELADLRVMAVQDLTRLAKKRANRIFDAEEAVEEIKAKQLTPEELADTLTAKQKEIDDLTHGFNEQWRERGDRSGDPSEGKPDFRASSAEDATYLYQKLIGADVEPGYYLARGDRRGPQLQRMLMMPYDVKKKYLVRNMEDVAKSFTSKMGADLELYRALDGSPNGSTIGQAASQEVHNLLTIAASSKFVKLPKGWAKEADGFVEKVNDRLAGFMDGEGLYLEAKHFSNEAKDGFVPLTPELQAQISRVMNAELKHQQRNWDVAIKRLRGTRSQALDEGGFMHRSGRVIKDLNVLTMMGMVLISSVPDAVRPVFVHGMTKVAGKGWAPYLTNLKSEGGRSFRMASHEANSRIGVALEVQLQGRAKEFMDLAKQRAYGRTKVERGVSALAGKAGMVGLFDLQTTLFKTVAADVVHATMGEYIPTVAKALARGNMDESTSQMLVYLRGRGLRDVDILRIGKMMEKPGAMEKFSNGGVIPNFDSWDDMAAFRSYAGAVTKETNKLVITPGLERPNWTDENLAFSLMAQFQSFLYGAHSRIVLSGLQGNEPYLLQGIAASLAAGAMAYYLSGVSRGGKAYDEVVNSSPQMWLYKAVDRSGILGAIHIPMGVGEKVPFLNEYWAFGGGEPKGRSTGADAVAAAGGPTASQLIKFGDLMVNVNKEGQADKNLAKARRLFMPYQNNFAFRRIFDSMADGLGY